MCVCVYMSMCTASLCPRISMVICVYGVLCLKVKSRAPNTFHIFAHHPLLCESCRTQRVSYNIDDDGVVSVVLRRTIQQKSRSNDHFSARALRSNELTGGACCRIIIALYKMIWAHAQCMVLCVWYGTAVVPRARHTQHDRKHEYTQGVPP